MISKKALFILIILLLFNLSLFAQDIKIPVEYERISDRVLILRTGNAYMEQVYAIASKRGLVVIDAGNSETQTKEYRKIIEREFNRKDFIYLINTHSHSDHTGGNQVFSDINIIAHDRVPQAMKQFELTRKSSAENQIKVGLPNFKNRLKSLDPKSEEARRLSDILLHYNKVMQDYLNNFVLTIPTLTFSDEMTLDLGDLTLKLFYYGEGAHTGDDIIIYCPEEKVVFSGDLFYRKSMQFANNPQFDAPKWILILGKIIDSDKDIKWIFDCHNGRMPGNFLKIRYKYISEIWNSLSNEKGKVTGIKEILEKYPYKNYSYLEESGLKSSDLAAQHLNNLRFTWLCLNNAQLGLAIIKKIINESGIDAAVKKFNEIKNEVGSKYYFGENEMNRFGYTLMNENKNKEAIEIFKMNVALFPNSFNVYDSLAEAYTKTGNKELAIENYEKSLKLNPNNTSGSDALKKLKEK